MEKKTRLVRTPLIGKMRLFPKVTKMAIFANFAKGLLGRQNGQKWPILGLNVNVININSVIVLVAFWRLLDHLRFVLSKKQLVKTPNIKEMRPFPKVAKIANFAKEI